MNFSILRLGMKICLKKVFRLNIGLKYYKHIDKQKQFYKADWFRSQYASATIIGLLKCITKNYLCYASDIFQMVGNIIAE